MLIEVATGGLEAEIKPTAFVGWKLETRGAQKPRGNLRAVRFGFQPVHVGEHALDFESQHRRGRFEVVDGVCFPGAGILMNGRTAPLPLPWPP